jgi:A/G-specific adenine glycosylase
MLQQTTVAIVIPYFLEFLKRWPDLEVLAVSGLDDVLHAWQGLGYYSRARNLHACAGVLMRDHGGIFPDHEAGLRELPGVGAYTAAAIAAIAFQRPAVVVDGNVKRVMARFFRVNKPLPGVCKELYARAAEMTPRTAAERPGDYAQAVMDLGATICTPRNPTCEACPWMPDCAAYKAGEVENLPQRAPRRERPLRRGVAFWVHDREGRVLLKKRPSRGLLGGMMEIPSTDWREKGWSLDEALDAAPFDANWTALPGRVYHGFTHFRLEMTILTGVVGDVIDDTGDDAAADQGVWSPPSGFSAHALSVLTRKIADHALQWGSGKGESKPRGQR